MTKCHVGPFRTLSEAPHQAGNVHWNNAVRNDGRISRLDASTVMVVPEGWSIDSWTPTFVDKNKECQLGSNDIWNDKKV